MNEIRKKYIINHENDDIVIRTNKKIHFEVITINAKFLIVLSIQSSIARSLTEVAKNRSFKV